MLSLHQKWGIMKKIFTYILLAFALMQPALSFAQSEKNAPIVRDEQSAEKVSAIVVSVSDNYLYLSGVKEGTKVEVMNMLGVSVLSFETANPEEKIALNLRKGFYVVKIENIVQRFVIK